MRFAVVSWLSTVVVVVKGYVQKESALADKNPRLSKKLGSISQSSDKIIRRLLRQHTTYYCILRSHLDFRIPSVKMSAFHPHRSVPSVPISQDIALKYVQMFLTATKSSPYLLPNARLEPSGPTAGSSASSVTIHNLQRVEAGLRGEWLAPSLDLQENAGEQVPVATGMEDVGEGDHMQVDGWQDLDEYQREQSIEEGEVGPRQTGLAQEGDEDFEERVDVESEVPTAKSKHENGLNGKSSGKAVDKKVKKQEKKLRLKEDKKKRRAEELKAKEADE